MASRARHIEQARQNAEVARLLMQDAPDGSCRWQWAMTAAFYAALHYVEAFLADLNLHSVDHHDRDTLLADPNVGFSEDGKDAYYQLKRWSNNARYDLATYIYLWKFLASHSVSHALGTACHRTGSNATRTNNAEHCGDGARIAKKSQLHKPGSAA